MQKNCCRLKLHYTVTDDSGSCSVVFWDKESFQLVNKMAVQSQFILAEVEIYNLSF